MAIVKICPTCGVSNAPTSPFCSECGVSLVSVAPSDPVEISPPPYDATPKNIGKAICTECGAENEGGCDRCVYCDCALHAPLIETGCTTIELTLLFASGFHESQTRDLQRIVNLALLHTGDQSLCDSSSP